MTSIFLSYEIQKTFIEITLLDHQHEYLVPELPLVNRSFLRLFSYYMKAFLTSHQFCKLFFPDGILIHNSDEIICFLQLSYLYKLVMLTAKSKPSSFYHAIMTDYTNLRYAFIGQQRFNIENADATWINLPGAKYVINSYEVKKLVIFFCLTYPVPFEVQQLVQYRQDLEDVHAADQSHAWYLFSLLECRKIDLYKRQKLINTHFKLCRRDIYYKLYFYINHLWLINVCFIVDSLKSSNWPCVFFWWKLNIFYSILSLLRRNN